MLSVANFGSHDISWDAAAHNLPAGTRGRGISGNSGAKMLSSFTSSSTAHTYYTFIISHQSVQPLDLPVACVPAVQIRAAIVPGGPSAAASVPVKRAGSGQGRGRPRKRKRGAWSSSDDDEAAPDYASEWWLCSPVVPVLLGRQWWAMKGGTRPM